jgi:hypothetical protein
MSERRDNHLKPALIGGAAAGALSGLPVIQCLCCLWIPAGAAFAVFLASRSEEPVRPGDGARIGAFAGIAAAVVHSLINIPFQEVHLAFYRRVFEHLSEYGQAMPDGWRDFFSPQTPRGFSAIGFLLGLLIFATIFAAFGALGGVIGASLFARKSPDVRPPAGPLPPQP